MNVFEDLVVELKQANLLESTVIETGEALEAGNAFDETVVPDAEYGVLTDVAAPVTANVETDEGEAISEQDIEAAQHETQSPNTAAPIAQTTAYAVAPPAKTDSDFFKKKAVAEVSALQMVEHIITGVEREYLKVVPKGFDDFNAKKALSTFLNSEDTIDSEGHATAEYNLMQETEAWCSALAVRDNQVPVSSLRQYCETSRPALSSQALLALGRFYRNLPYSEAVRSKFDFVVTRLFSRSMNLEKRVCLFTRDETLAHINTLYSDWSSVPLYAVDEDDSKVMLTALSFEDLAIEAENADSFDRLIENDFFGRLRMFKESIAELFYAPQVAAAAIECNIRIGNAYVDLIDRERQKIDLDSLRLKYGEHDVTVSEVTGKTLELPDLLRQLGETIPDESPRPVAQSVETPAEPLGAPDKSRAQKGEAAENTRRAGISSALGNINKWILVFASVMIAASAGLYLWANLAAEGKQPTTAGVKTYDVGNTTFADHVKTVRISGDMFYAQMSPSWDTLPKEKRLEILQRIYKTARESGASQVTLISLEGKNAGYASAARMEVIMP